MNALIGGIKLREGMTFLLILILLWGCSNPPKGNTPLNGIILLQNSGGQPIEGAKISAQGTNEVYSLKNGEFSLIFPKRNPGDNVHLAINKEGMEVVDRKALTFNLPRHPDTVKKIVMCKIGERDKFAREYCSIAEKYINQVLHELGDQIHEKDLNDQEKKKLFIRLAEEYEAALNHAGELADKFAKVNIDDISGVHKKAFDYFTQENIKIALEVLDIRILGENIRNADEEVKSLEGIEEQTVAKKRVIETKREQSIQSLIFKARLLILDFQFEQAEKHYAFAIEADRTNFDYLTEFTNFLREQKKYTRALHLNEKALSIFKKPGKKVTILYNLGLLYIDMNQLKKAGKTFTKALEIYRELEEENPNAYGPDLALTYINLGSFHTKTNRYPKAKQAYTEALEILEDLIKNYPETYKRYAALTYSNLGLLHSKTGGYQEAGAAFAKSIGIYRELAKKNPCTYLPELANTLNGMGLLKNETNQFKEAGEAYSEALEIYRALEKEIPYTYGSDLAIILLNLGSLYSNTNRLQQAEEALTEALEIFQQLTKNNREAYERYVAIVNSNLGILYFQTDRFQQAEEANIVALNIYRELVKNDRDTYLPEFVNTLKGLGLLYYYTNRLEEAEEANTEALDLYGELAKKNRDTYLPQLADILVILGDFNSSPFKLFTGADKLYIEGLEIYRELAEEKPNKYRPKVAGALWSLGIYYFYIMKNKEAGEAFTQVFEMYQELARKNPDTYLEHLAGSLNSLGKLALRTDRYKEGITYLKKAIDIWKQLVEINPEKFELELCHSYIVLSIVHIAELKTKTDESKEKEVLSILDLVIDISKKYKENERAQFNIKSAEAQKKRIEKLKNKPIKNKSRKKRRRGRG